MSRIILPARRFRTTLAILMMPAVGVLASAAASRAQGQRPAPDPALAARNEEFLRAAAQRNARGAARFFPRQGSWEWVQVQPGGGTDVLIRRFSAAETARAIDLGGPACELFDGPRGRVGPLSGASLAIQATMYGARWPRAGSGRFVSPETDESPPVFVEWRRENGTWVVSRIGVRMHYTPPVPGPGRYIVSEDRSGQGFATTQPWYASGRGAIEYRGADYVYYGLPRPVPANEITRVGTLDGVAVHAEAPPLAPEILYVAVAPDQFQPYRLSGQRPCFYLPPPVP